MMIFNTFLLGLLYKKVYFCTQNATVTHALGGKNIHLHGGKGMQRMDYQALVTILPRLGNTITALR